MIYTECLKNKSKEELFALGKKIVEEFADVNNLLMPRINKIGFNYRFPDNRYFEVIEKFEKKLEKRFGGSKY